MTPHEAALDPILLWWCQGRWPRLHCVRLRRGEMAKLCWMQCYRCDMTQPLNYVCRRCGWFRMRIVSRRLSPDIHTRFVSSAFALKVMPSTPSGWVRRRPERHPSHHTAIPAHARPKLRVIPGWGMRSECMLLPLNLWTVFVVCADPILFSLYDTILIYVSHTFKPLN